ncbi:MAG: hypothetical protein UV01_C0003G0105 [Parcubacteria group bacterium GW2011_GWA2_42_14]|nr:MAG: hypothetical protein UV01_C0003G0105 [Parcubacteria group bacterium GW2011_GWA2_42_14]
MGIMIDLGLTIITGLLTISNVRNGNKRNALLWGIATAFGILTLVWIITVAPLLH